MKITYDKLKKWDACSQGLKWFSKNYCGAVDYTTVLNDLYEAGVYRRWGTICTKFYNHAEWLIKKILYNIPAQREYLHFIYNDMLWCTYIFCWNGSVWSGQFEEFPTHLIKKFGYTKAELEKICKELEK